jgi:hypothetical protein
MCFSATASLTAGAFLLGVGAMTIRMANTPGTRAYGAIPLRFAIQQLIEGVVWLSFEWNSPQITAAATQAYSLFSHVLWPVYIPIAALLIEKDEGRRRILGALCVAGLGVASFLLYSMFEYPIRAVPTGGHIDFLAPHFYAALSMGLYFTATTLSLMLSTHRWVRFFGILALGSAAAAYGMYARWFISVWCFFAGMMSIAVALQLWAGRSGTSELAVGDGK